MKQPLAMNQSITWLWERGVASGQQELMFEFRFKCESNHSILFKAKLKMGSRTKIKTDGCTN